MATMQTAEQVQRAVASLEAERGKAAATGAKITLQLADLEQRRQELQLDSDLGIADVAKDLAAVEKRLGECRGASERAQAAVAELDRRIRAVQAPLEDARHAARMQQLADLAPLAGTLTERYRAALTELVATAAEMNRVRQQVRGMQNDARAYFEKRHQVAPPSTPIPPKPAPVHDAWLTHLDAPQRLAAWFKGDAPGAYRTSSKRG